MRCYPRDEVIALYHERWELELGFDESKTGMLDSLPTLRSQRRALVEQELLGILIAYKLVRGEIERAAVPPLRISFTSALLMIVDALQTAWSMTPGAIPAYLRLIERRATPPRFPAFVLVLPGKLALSRSRLQHEPCSKTCSQSVCSWHRSQRMPHPAATRAPQVPRSRPPGTEPLGGRNTRPVAMGY